LKAGIRSTETLDLGPGSRIDFEVNDRGRIEIRRVGAPKAASSRRKDRFERARGRATVKWKTADLMRLLRGDE
jgi:hypothetical protein